MPLPRTALWDQIIFDREPLSSRKRPCGRAPPVVANPLALYPRGMGYGFLTLVTLVAFVALVITGEQAAYILDSEVVEDNYTGAIGESSLTRRISWA